MKDRAVWYEVKEGRGTLTIIHPELSESFIFLRKPDGLIAEEDIEVMLKRKGYNNCQLKKIKKGVNYE